MKSALGRAVCLYGADLDEFATFAAQRTENKAIKKYLKQCNIEF